MHKTSDLRIDMFGIVPEFTLGNQKFDAQTIVALAGLLTFTGKSVHELYQNTIDKEQDLDKKVLKILQKSSLRGHASIATTPVISLSFQGSKFLDALLTPLVFASGLMASGRRTGTTEEDIVFPSAIATHPEAQKIYHRASTENIRVFNELLDKGLRKDEVSKILQYGIIGTGIVSLSVESLVAFAREYERERDWMPEDAGLFLDKVKAELKNLGIDILYPTRFVAPKDVYPFPNIFKDPQHVNLARDLRQMHDLPRMTKVLELHVQATDGLKSQLQALSSLRDEMTQSQQAIKDKWWDFLALREKICRDYASCLHTRILSSISWRVWGEKKRHRTVPMVSESLYHKIDQAIRFFEGTRSWDDIDRIFTIPPGVKKDDVLSKIWVERAADSLQAYKQLIALGIKPCDAVYVIPRAIRIDIVQDYNLYNLISGYFPLRLCTTAEEQMLAITEEETRQIKRKLADLDLDVLAEHIVPKCQVVGFCPEETNCQKVYNLVENYSLKFHKDMKVELEKKWRDRS